MATPRLEIVTLYRYFAYAAHMRDLFRQSVTVEKLKELSADEQGLVCLFYSTPGLYLLYSYSGLYLVVEGWQDLKLTDAKVDALIASPYVERLKRFRNATFHYQKVVISPKHLEFFGTEEEKTEEWVGQLYDELARFFRENTLPLPPDLKGSLKGKEHLNVALTIRQALRNGGVVSPDSPQ